jgi:hypothetical protein
MNPIDEFLEMKKTAAPKMPKAHHTMRMAEAGKRVAQGVGKGLGGAMDPRTLSGQVAATGLTIAGSAALMAMVPAAQKIHTAVTKNRDFKQMMEVNPHLEEVREQNPEMFGHAYDSLRSLNPTFGKDPLVAGAYMNKMMMNPEQAGITLSQSVKQPAAPQPFDPFKATPFKVAPGGGGGGGGAPGGGAPASALSASPDESAPGALDAANAAFNL